MTKKQMTGKLISLLHLWPGLISAVIVFFVCLTGTVLVYCDEIMELSAGKARYVEQAGEQKIPVEELIQIIRKEYPQRKSISYMVAYKDPKRSVRFNTYSAEEGLQMVYIDPYTGKILKDDPTIFFFYVTAHLHNSFLLGKTGQWIVDIATLIFILELLTGLYLWWPRRWNQTARKAAFTVKWTSTKKRLNYDIHKVLGFYALGILLLLSLTGLLIAFKPLSTTLLNVLGADTSHQWEAALPASQPDRKAFDLNTLLTDAWKSYPDKEEIQLYTYKLESTGYYMLRVADRIGLKSAQSPEYKVYNKYTGEAIELPARAVRHEKIENAVWVLHMGNWMGQLGKFVTFMGGLIATLLPITGFYIWWGKKRKEKR